MFLIDYIQSPQTFSIEVVGKLEEEEFKSHTTFLKQISLHYNENFRKWFIPKNRIDEILLWLVKKERDFETSTEALDKLREVSEEWDRSETKFFRNKKIDYSVLPEGKKLFEHQKSGATFRIQRSCYMDCDDAGVGKTPQNIEVFSTLYKNRDVDGILIIVPTGFTYHWKYHILDFSNIFKEDDIQMIENSNKEKCFSVYRDKKVLIIPNHLLADCLLSYRKDYDKLKSAKRIRWSKVVDIREEWNKKIIFTVVDESDEIKHSSSIRSKAVLSLKPYSYYRACLSATPAINKIEHFYNQIYFLDKSILSMSENAFKVWISKEIGNQYDKYAILSYDENSVKEFYRKLQPILIKRLKEDIPGFNVKKYPQKIALQLTDLQQKIYKEVFKEEIILLEKEFDQITYRQILNKFPTIMAVIDNPTLLKKNNYANTYLQDLINSYKIEEDPKFIVLKTLVNKWIDNNGEKLVVYGFHPETLNTLFEKFKKYNPLIVHGQVNKTAEERYGVQEKFNKDPKHKIVFLSALTSSKGLNLQEGGRINFVYETPDNTTFFRQLSDRTHRIVSARDTLLKIPYYPDTVDNIRIERAFNRVELNDKLGKVIGKLELKNLLRGIL